MFISDVAVLGAVGLAAFICGLEHGGWKWGEAALCFLAMAAPMLFPNHITGREGAVVMILVALRPVIFGECTKFMALCRIATGLIMGVLMWRGMPPRPMGMAMHHMQAMSLSGPAMVPLLLVALTLSAYFVALGCGAIRLLGRPVPRLGMIAAELSALVAALIGMAQMAGGVM